MPALPESTFFGNVVGLFVNFDHIGWKLYSEIS